MSGLEEGAQTFQALRRVCWADASSGVGSVVVGISLTLKVVGFWFL